MLIEYEIYKTLVISIAHISEETNNFLLDNETQIDRFGFWLWVSYWIEYEDLPFDLVEICKLAKVLDCEVIRIDRDGPKYDNLKTYDW
jgi:hypothetical protein